MPAGLFASVPPSVPAPETPPVLAAVSPGTVEPPVAVLEIFSAPGVATHVVWIAAATAAAAAKPDALAATLVARAASGAATACVAAGMAAASLVASVAARAVAADFLAAVTGGAIATATASDLAAATSRTAPATAEDCAARRLCCPSAAWDAPAGARIRRKRQLLCPWQVTPLHRERALGHHQAAVPGEPEEPAPGSRSKPLSGPSGPLSASGPPLPRSLQGLLAQLPALPAPLCLVAVLAPNAQRPLRVLRPWAAPLGAFLLPYPLPASSQSALPQKAWALLAKRHATLLRLLLPTVRQPAEVQDIRT
mmetsp:Transcript_75222/g.207529  ORF Transcript_75222/g.207529 Transcript_75222/m.207529 type:complete len:309 (-) Transcript_75222:915-1841(-)